MINRTTRLRWRRRVRQKRRQVEDLSVQAEASVERYFFRRLNRFAPVRRFVFGWIILSIVMILGVLYQFSMLGGYYQKIQPVAGGTFTEGMVGSFSDANPLFASGPVDGSVARLLFGSLLTYDAKGALVGDLAESYTVDERARVYTVTLKNNIVWHDGREFTADDVVYTYQLIQNPDVRSPLFTSWQSVKVEKKDDRTVLFTLPASLASFPHSLTNGIIPEHVLSQYSAAQMRTIPFNTAEPIGTGPFKFVKLEVTQNNPERREGSLVLVPNDSYHLGAPKLDRFVIRYFSDDASLADSFRNGELTAMTGLDTVPDDLQMQGAVARDYETALNGQVMAFFKTSLPPLNDAKVRQALTAAVNRSTIISQLGFPAAVSNGPLLPDQIGYDKNIVQLPYNKAAAEKLLDESGWVKGADGMRIKDGKPLQVNLYSQSGSEYAVVAKELQKAWKEVGVQVSVSLQADEDLQSTLNYHTYDVLLYGISLGSDPDVFAYWHSSQAEPAASGGQRVNFSEYKSKVADSALEGGRTRSEPALRAAKYRPFLEAWRTDAPAVALYQTRYLYIAQVDIAGFNQTVINSAFDRYSTVHNWMILQEKVKK